MKTIVLSANLTSKRFTVRATKAEARGRIAPYITTVTSFLVAEQMRTTTRHTLQQCGYYFRKAAAKFVFKAVNDYKTVK